MIIYEIKKVFNLMLSLKSTQKVFLNHHQNEPSPVSNNEMLTLTITTK